MKKNILFFMIMSLCIAGCNNRKSQNITMCTTLHVDQILEMIPQTKDQIDLFVQKSQKKITDLIAKIRKQAHRHLGYYVTVAEISRAHFLYKTDCQVLQFLTQLGKSDLQQYALQKLNQYKKDVEPVLYTKDMYNVLQEYSLHGHDEYVHDEYIQSILDIAKQQYAREGVLLDKKQKQALDSINAQIASSAQQFAGAIHFDTPQVEIAESIVHSFPESIQTQLIHKNNQWFVPISAPVYHDIMEYTQDASVQKILYQAFVRRAYPRNEQNITSILQWNHTKAQLLGFESSAQMFLQQQSFEKVEHVYQYLESMYEDVTPIIEKKMHELAQEYPDAFEGGKLCAYKEAYVKTMYQEEELQIDHEAIAQYFELQDTIKRMMHVLSQAFYVIIEPVHDKISVWADDVYTFQVRDAATKGIRGYIFLDLFDRPGKTQTPCYISLLSSVVDDCNIACAGAGVITMNLHKQKGPQVLNLFDVSQLFHEMGHACEDLIGQRSVSQFLADQLSFDLSEVIAYITQELLYTPEVLESVARHHKTGKPMPAGMIRGIMQAHAWQDVMSLEKQLFLSLFSYTLFETWKPGMNVDALFRQMYTKYRPWITYEPENHVWCSLAHLAGYGPLQYAYVKAHDLSRSFVQAWSKKGILKESTVHEVKQILFPADFTVEKFEQSIRNFSEQR